MTGAAPSNVQSEPSTAYYFAILACFLLFLLLYTRIFDIGSHPRAFYARVVDCLVARSLPVSNTLPSISVASTKAPRLALTTLSPPCANWPRFHIITTSSSTVSLPRRLATPPCANRPRFLATTTSTPRPPLSDYTPSRHPVSLSPLLQCTYTLPSNSYNTKYFL